MHGLFLRAPNGDGYLQWRCIQVAQGNVPHVKVTRGGYIKSIVAVTCNIKRSPRQGAYCRRPSYYM